MGAVREVKRFYTERTEEGGENSEKDWGVYRRGAEDAEKSWCEIRERDANECCHAAVPDEVKLTLWQAGAQQAAPLPSISLRGNASSVMRG